MTPTSTTEHPAGDGPAFSEQLGPALPPPCPDPDSRTKAALVAWAVAYADQRVAAERERWIVACNTVSDDAERHRRPGVQTVAQVRKLAIDGPNEPDKPRRHGVGA